jgi:GTP1/Obg family GTP-binding protein
MDKWYENVKTGERKPLPINVYKAVRKHWRPVEERPQPIIDISPESVFMREKAQELRDEINTRLADKIASVTTGKDIELTVESVGIPNDLTPAKESLQTVYETLSGQKADKRWNEKKLIQKIEELKETK